MTHFRQLLLGHNPREMHLMFFEWKYIAFDSLGVTVSILFQIALA